MRSLILIPVLALSGCGLYIDSLTKSDGGRDGGNDAGSKCSNTNLDTDPNNCGACGNVCPTPANAPATCVEGVCGRGECDSAFVDLDGPTTLGCEMRCACTDQCTPTSADECCPAASETRACENGCGEEKRTCDTNGKWGAWSTSTCTACCAGATEDRQCQTADAGNERRTCDTAGAWGEWSTCMVCTAGATQQRACANKGCGMENRTCSATGTWSAWSTCTACCPGAVEERACSNGGCGKEKRTCSAAGAWGAWSTCTACCPGQTQERACSNGGCGKEKRTCSTAGSWGSWSTCPVCCNGSTQTRACLECGKQTRTCSSGNWGAWAGCGVDTAKNGRVCRASAFTCDPAETCSGASPSCPADYQEFPDSRWPGMCFRQQRATFSPASIAPANCNAHHCVPNHAPTLQRRCVEAGYKVYETYTNGVVAGDCYLGGRWNGSAWERVDPQCGQIAMTSVTCYR